MSSISSILLVTLLVGSKDPQPSSSGPTAFCRGEYADNVAVLAPGAREIEDEPYSYCVRSTAIYECLSYGSDGNVRRNRQVAVTHGTGFAYKHQNGGTLLLTNHHVSEWPLVTDAAHPAAAVPVCCKRIDDTLRIVEGEGDNYAADDIELSRVVQDLSLDASILRAKQKLSVLPWKLGKSSTLRERNFVQVRGFPLGVFQATNDGKVISAYDHDTDKEWDHDDFVIDALLSHGSSGSPVLAISCKTGEFELVGMFHAGYTGGNALNVVVGIDELKETMTTLKKRPRPKSDFAVAVNREARAKLLDNAISPIGGFFPFGTLVALISRRMDDTLVYSVFPKDFPLASYPLMVIEDRPDAVDFGRLGRIWFGGIAGLKEYGRSDLDHEALANVDEILEALRRDALLAAAHREAKSRPLESRKAHEELVRLERAMKRFGRVDSDLADQASDLAVRLGPRFGVDPVVSASSVFTSSIATDHVTLRGSDSSR